MNKRAGLGPVRVTECRPVPFATCLHPHATSARPMAVRHH